MYKISNLQKEKRCYSEITEKERKDNESDYSQGYKISTGVLKFHSRVNKFLT